MIIRPATQEDIAALLPMYEKMYGTLSSSGLPFKLDAEELPKVLGVTIKSKLCYLGIAEENGEFLGYVQASIAKLDRKLSHEDGKTIGIINDVFVKDEARGRGLATALCESAENWMRESGLTLSQAQVLCKNEPARAFWSSRGYNDLHITVCKKL